jgi:hypothetical protein
MTGTIVSVHLSACRYGGAFGEILGDDGEHYTYTARECYRDGTEPSVGLRVSFEADPSSRYARQITRRMRTRQP